MEQSCNTPFEELRESALAHYNELSTKSMHWNSFIYDAIKAYKTDTPVKEDTLLPIDYFRAGYKYFREVVETKSIYDEASELTVKKAFSEFENQTQASTDTLGWEIVKCDAVKGGLHPYEPSCIELKCTIHSVLRKSDNTLFSLGEIVKVTGSPNGEEAIKDWWGKITEFWITGYDDMHICYNGHHYDIKYFEKKLPTQSAPINDIIQRNYETLYFQQLWEIKKMQERIDNHEMEMLDA